MFTDLQNYIFVYWYIGYPLNSITAGVKFVKETFHIKSPIYNLFKYLRLSVF